MSVLSKKMSIRSTHHELPFGTPEGPSFANTLAREEMQEANRPRKQSVADSEGTFSSFSSVDIPSTEDPGEDTLVMANLSAEEWRLELIASLISKRKDMDPFGLLPRIFELCSGSDGYLSSCPEDSSQSSSSIAHGPDKGMAPVINGDLALRRYSFDHKDNLTLAEQHHLRPRRFSFDLGDDSGFGSLQSFRRPEEEDASETLRRSSSAMASLTGGTELNQQIIAAFPDVPAGPSTPLTAGFPPSSSLIPSPVYPAGRARPRREASNSSVQTIVLHSPEEEISDPMSFESTKRQSTDSLLGSPPDLAKRRSSSNVGQRLVEEKQCLRSNSMAVAAARAAGQDSKRSSDGSIRTSSQGR